MEHTEGRAPTAGQVRLSGAERRVLRDLAALVELTRSTFSSRRAEASLRDWISARDSLVRAKFIEVVDTVPSITPAGLLALRGAP